MLNLFLSLLAIFVLLVLTEAAWRSGKLHVEVSRKIVHMGTGAFIAFWPLYMKWEVIQAASILLLVAVIVSHKLKIFKSIHMVERITRGEILYPVGIAICAFLEPIPWVFTAAVLHLALADGMAAIIGTKYGHRTRYQLISHGKSLAGSAAFFATSVAIFICASFFLSHDTLPHIYAMFALSAFILTLVENISWYGLDDITVPVSVIVILTLLPTYT